jgi:hypothetical protein
MITQAIGIGFVEFFTQIIFWIAFFMVPLLMIRKLIT